jgi:hypothetical protein
LGRKYEMNYFISLGPGTETSFGDLSPSILLDKFNENYNKSRNKLSADQINIT